MSAADGRLSDGMVIVGRVRARLLGMQLLDLDADVTVTPAAQRRGPHPAVEQRTRPAVAATNGTVGAGLGEAARALEATSGELMAVRRAMP